MKKAIKRSRTDQNEALNSLAAAVGNFIRYWGFRRIHGQIWTHVYLSEKPLSGTDLVNRLQVSKALVSPALSELLEYQLIVGSEVDGRTKVYTAVPDVCTVIRKILNQREKKLIQEARKKFEVLKNSSTDSSDELIYKDRLSALGEMIGAAEFALEFIIQSSDSDSLSNYLSLLQSIKET